jgi:hypothetical protein
MLVAAVMGTGEDSIHVDVTAELECMKDTIGELLV